MQWVVGTLGKDTYYKKYDTKMLFNVIIANISIYYLQFLER